MSWLGGTTKRICNNYINGTCKSDAATCPFLHTTSKKLLVCTFPGCDRHFVSAWGLKCHLKGHSSTLKAFSCSTCTMKFKSRSDCTKHEKRHFGRVHACPHKTRQGEQCRSFKTEFELRNHIMRIHTPDKKQLGCSVESCKRRFVSPHELRRHLKQVHHMDGVTPTSPPAVNSHKAPASAHGSGSNESVKMESVQRDCVTGISSSIRATTLPRSFSQSPTVSNLSSNVAAIPSTQSASSVPQQQNFTSPSVDASMMSLYALAATLLVAGVGPRPQQPVPQPTTPSPAVIMSKFLELLNADTTARLAAELVISAAQSTTTAPPITAAAPPVIQHVSMPTAAPVPPSSSYPAVVQSALPVPSTSSVLHNMGNVLAASWLAQHSAAPAPQAAMVNNSSSSSSCSSLMRSPVDSMFSPLQGLSTANFQTTATSGAAPAPSSSTDPLLNGFRSKISPPLRGGRRLPREMLERDEIEQTTVATAGGGSSTEEEEGEEEEEAKRSPVPGVQLSRRAKSLLNGGNGSGSDSSGRSSRSSCRRKGITISPQHQPASTASSSVLSQQQQCGRSSLLRGGGVDGTESPGEVLMLQRQMQQHQRLRSGGGGGGSGLGGCCDDDRNVTAGKPLAAVGSDNTAFVQLCGTVSPPTLSADELMQWETWIKRD